MKIDSEKLLNIMIEVASDKFFDKSFARRRLMDATEEHVRKLGLWENSDDVLSGSRGLKSKGLANIDYRFSEMARREIIIKDKRNVWILTDNYRTRKKNDLADTIEGELEPPERTLTSINKIARDRNITNKLKDLYDYRCQVCGIQIKTGDNKYYIEVHHIKPLGGEHFGVDCETNMLVLCPNHHAMFDFGIPIFISNEEVEIYKKKYRLKIKHGLAKDSIDYYNKRIFCPTMPLTYR